MVVRRCVAILWLRFLSNASATHWLRGCLLVSIGTMFGREHPKINLLSNTTLWSVTRAAVPLWCVHYFAYAGLCCLFQAINNMHCGCNVCILHCIAEPSGVCRCRSSDIVSRILSQKVDVPRVCVALCMMVRTTHCAKLQTSQVYHKCC